MLLEQATLATCWHVMRSSLASPVRRKLFLSSIIQLSSLVPIAAPLAALLEHHAEETGTSWLWWNGELSALVLLPLGGLGVESEGVHILIGGEAQLDLGLRQSSNPLGHNDLVAFDLGVTTVCTLLQVAIG